MTLFYLICAWLIGIALARTATLPWWGWFLLSVPTVGGAILARRTEGERRFSWPLIFVCLTMITLGAARLSAATPHFDEDDLATYNDQGFVALDGLIVDAPDVRDTTTYLHVRAESIALDGENRPATGLVLVQTPSVTAYRYGDPVRVQGEIVTPPEFDDFSYRDYLARQGVYSLMQYATVDVTTGPRRGSPVRAALFDFRERAQQTIMRLLPDPHASLLAGILLGIESGISPGVMDAFSAVGATHIIVISGSNLVILAGVFQSTFKRFLSVRWTAFVTILSVFVYAAFVGGDPAVTRAAIMVALTLIAPLFGRRTYGPSSLSFAVFLMTLADPFALWDVSFQLSALATLGLICFVEPLESLMRRGLSAVLSAQIVGQVVRFISDALIVTLAAQIATTPIIVYYFERLSPLSLVVNFLIIPVQPYVMVLGGIGVILALVVFPLGQLFAWGSWLFLSWTWLIVGTFARLPGASLVVEDMSSGLIWGIYVAIFIPVLVSMQEPGWMAKLRGWWGPAFGAKALGSAGVMVAVLIGVAAGQLPDRRLHVMFADVGDGTATLIETPGGRHILVDAGGSGRQLSAAMGSELPFWDRRLDLLVLTGPTGAQVAALPSILNRYQFDAVLTNNIRSEDELSQSAWAVLDERATPALLAEPGAQIVVGDGVTLTVLYAQVGEAPDGESDQPLVLMLTYGDARILLASDLTPEIEASLLAGNYILDSTVLLVPRGGHREANNEAFLQAVSPQIGVISVEAGNRSGLPHPETLARLEAVGSAIYRTDESGTIRLTTDGQRLWIRTSR